MKKLLFFSCFFIILLVGFITYKDYYNYKTLSNQFVISVVNEVKKEYPDFDESKLIKVINQDNYSNSIVNDYGLDSNDLTILKSYEENYKKSMYINLCIIIVFLLIILMFYYFIRNREKRQLNKVINYIRKINNGIYDLKIEENKEGIYSILENEIYTTTIMLKEQNEQSLKDKNDLKESLENISHQIKTPLTSIMLLVDNLNDTNMDNKMRKEFIDDIKLQVDNINNLIINLLKISKLDANVVKFKKESINVKKLVLDCLKYLDILIDLKNLNINVSGANNVSFSGDYKWEFEAICNIIKNCIEYSEENKNIFINFAENNCYTKIIIEDQGPGIDEYEKKKIFSRFYQGKNCFDNNFGIGLALAKEIINKDGGNITFKSIKNSGTKFIIKYYK